VVKATCDFCLEVAKELFARGRAEVCGVCFDEAAEADEAENRKLDKQ
jgi:bacterioferritin-associated ferredoxin